MVNVRRRNVLSLLAGAAASRPLSAYAQQAERVRRIGVLIPLAENDTEAKAEFTAFRDRLRRLGWIAGRNASIEARWAAGDVERIRTYARELVAWQPDVVLTRTTAATAGLLKETRTIPVVFVGPSDPVGAGFVVSLARPGGNATGFTNVEASLGGKWVQLLKEIRPRIAHIAVMFDPKTSPGGGSFYLRLVEDAARSIGVPTTAMPVKDVAEIERSIDAVASNPDGGLIVQPDVLSHNNRALIIALAARLRVPAIYAYPFYVAEGALAAYGVNVVDLYQRAAVYVDRILRGDRPSELAVQAPVKFDLAINLKTAAALNLVVAPTLIVRADTVIE